MFLLLYFGALVLGLMVAAGVMSWYWAVALGVAFYLIERKIVRAGHITDGDHASDEHGAYRDEAIQGPAPGKPHESPVPTQIV